MGNIRVVEMVVREIEMEVREEEEVKRGRENLVVGVGRWLGLV